MFGKRPDGRRIKGTDPVVQITPYIMPMRCDAQVFLKIKADMEKLSRFIRKQKLENDEQISYMQLIVASYVRALSRNPEINRFIMNRKLYARNNCSVAFIALKDPSDVNSPETVAKVRFDLTDTIFDVRDRMEAAVAANRAENASGFIDRLLNVLFAVPALPRLVAGVVRFLDNHGLAPAVLIEELPFYVSMFITNTASLGINDVNHHLYNWGNVGSFMGMGMTEKIAVIENGETRMKRFLPIGITVDERVCSGAHYARFLNDMKYFLKNPELLEAEPENVCFDQGLEYHEPKPARASA